MDITSRSSEMEWVIGRVRRAAALLPGYGVDSAALLVQSKGAFDVVTAADTAIEDFLCREIQKRFPNDAILAEESCERSTPSISGRCWVVDPLDGTVNFLSGIPCFSLSVALLVDGSPSLGVVFDPTRDELFFAEKGSGAFVEDAAGCRQLRASESSFHRCLAGSSGCLARWSKEPGTLAGLLQRYGKLRILGSQALHLCYAAAGRFEAAMSVEAKLWDDAAGALVVMESGLKYTDFEGRPRFPLAAESPWLRGASADTLAAPGSTHDDLIRLFHRSTAEDA